MAFRIFYAWQSDRANNLCRGLIRKALDQAAALLNEDLSIEDVDRSVLIDQDTQGVPGSPGVAETILEKIRTCDAFVPDLTIVHDGVDSRRAPNPNVLVEYGFALHALGDRRIIGVLNEGFGRPDDLPFDLRHKKWPVRYVATDDGKDEEAQQRRKEARQQLARDLSERIRDVLRFYAQEKKGAANMSAPRTTSAVPPAQLESDAELARPAEVVSTPPLRGLIHHPWENGIVGVRAGRRQGEAGYEMHLLDGPSLILHVKARNTGIYLSNKDTLHIAQRALQPLAYYRGGGRDIAYNPHGVALFTTLNDSPNTAVAASLLTRYGELHGIDCYHLQVSRFRGEPKPPPYVPTGAVEEILIDGLANFLDVAKNYLRLSPPIEVFAGLNGVRNCWLAVEPSLFDGQQFVGPIMSDVIGETVAIQSFEHDPFDALVKLFNRIYDEAFVERPNVRTVGKSQR